MPILILGMLFFAFTITKLLRELTLELKAIKQSINAASYAQQSSVQYAAKQTPVPDNIDYNRLSNAIESALLNANVKLHNAGVDA